MRCGLFYLCLLSNPRSDPGLASLSQYDLDMSKATGAAEAAKDDFLSKLNKVVQLTGKFDFL